MSQQNVINTQSIVNILQDLFSYFKLCYIIYQSDTESFNSSWSSVTCLLLLISMLWHRQAIFESKGDKLSSSAECRIRTWTSQNTYSPADWMPTHKPTELSRIKLKNLNSTACPYDEWAFSPLYFNAIWLSHLALAIYMFVVVNFYALAQASHIQI